MCCFVVVVVLGVSSCSRLFAEVCLCLLPAPDMRNPIVESMVYILKKSGVGGEDRGDDVGHFGVSLFSSRLSEIRYKYVTVFLDRR